LDGLDLREVAGPVMRRLVDVTGETAVLLVPHRTDAVCILQVEGSSPIRPRSVRIGDRVPYNAGAAPLAILAFLPPEERQLIIDNGFPALTSLTIVDPLTLRDRCADVVRSGVAYSRGEAILGTAAVAAPIFDAVDDRIAASIALTGIEAKIVDMEAAVMQAASEISRQLGAHGAPGGIRDC
jgi:DNA-binding IclR family transcriptional regulator